MKLKESTVLRLVSQQECFFQKYYTKPIHVLTEITQLACRYYSSSFSTPYKIEVPLLLSVFLRNVYVQVHPRNYGNNRDCPQEEM